MDAFNPETGWVNRDVIGIDLGITLVQAENARTGFVWAVFMQAPEVQQRPLCPDRFISQNGICLVTRQGFARYQPPFGTRLNPYRLPRRHWV